MTISGTSRVFVVVMSLGAVLALSGASCRPAAKKVETYLGDEKSVVNSPAAEGVKAAASEAAGPAGTAMGVGEAALGAVNTGALLAIKNDADTAFAEALANPNDPALERRAEYLGAKADCFLRKDCKKWYELTGKTRDKDSGGSH